MTKKELARKITLSVLAGAVLMSSGFVWAAEITTAPPHDSWPSSGDYIISPKDSFSGNVVKWNNVTIEPGIETKGYAGGYNSSDVSDNSITMIGGELKGSNSIFGGYATSGDAVGNRVELDGVKAEGDSANSTTSSSYWTIYGGRSDDGNVTNNEIVIKNGANTILGSIFGGQTNSGGTANNNKVSILSGTFVENIHGGVTNSGNAKNNTVNIEGGTFKGKGIKIIGGQGIISEGNIINVSGGTFGTSDDWFRIIAGVGDEVKNNIINIEDDVGLSKVSLYGASKDLNAVSTKGSGNKLNINGWKGNVNTIQYFNNINFENTKWNPNENESVVKVTATLGFVDDTTVTFGDMKRNSGAAPVVGDKMTLMDSIYDIYGSIEADESSFKIGSFVRAKGKISQEGSKKINLELISVSANEQILALGESRAAATAFTNQGSELIETGLDALARDNEKDTKVFAALYGNASDYETGSYVKVNGFNGIVGVGKTKDNGVTMGAFFENGEGNYRTFNNYEGEMMRGDGEATYNGGGFLYRKDNASGVYTEASLRAGNLQNELRNVAIAGDELVGYDIDTFYYGAHIGVGKIIPRGTEGDNIDIYGKLIYTHYDDEDFKIDGDKFHLDSVESERLRLGFRINEVQDSKLTMYYGAAWEYEFGGDSDNTVEGYLIDVNSPSLGGGTVIGEVGMHYNASEKWSFDLNGRAYGGQRDGWSGSIQANYMF